VADSPSLSEILASLAFALALLHTFLTPFFKRMERHFHHSTILKDVFELLGEVEVVFGLWAFLLLAALVPVKGLTASLDYFESRSFAEPVFVFVIMTCCASRPILELASTLMRGASKFFPVRPSLSLYMICLTLGPLLGSFITEPAAMTVTALVLKELYFDHSVSKRFKYLTIGTLFVNISVGGVLTPYAAPPVLMVARIWNWDLSFMLEHFGWRAILICLINTIVVSFLLRSEFSKIQLEKQVVSKSPWWISILNLFFLVVFVLVHSRPMVLLGIFLFYLGVTKVIQQAARLREGLMVAFFLGGLVVLGGLQTWWLEPLLKDLNPSSLFLGSTLLTAITDNAAITYLGAQIPSVTDAFKYALVAGAVTGGGLTVIANAPNPAGFSLLQKSFGESGIHHGRLFISALIPTFIAALIFWFF
jgi:hypothetical protein